MPKINFSSIYLGSGLLLLAGFAQAAPPSIAGTSWELAGKFSGKASVKCQFGGSRSVPIKGRKNLKGTIYFDDGDVIGDGEGTFSWQDQSFSVVTVTGTWEQQGAKFTFAFDHWYDSPMAAFASALSGMPVQWDVSQGGANASLNALNPTKLTLSGTINAKGNKLTLVESMGFKFDASASYAGSFNSCSYNFSNLGRSYSGKRLGQ